MPEKFMKLLNLWGNPSTEIKETATVLDEGFLSAETVESGQSHEVVLDFMKPAKNHFSFLFMRGEEDNEWVLRSRDASAFHLRAIVFFESEGEFSAHFDSKFVYSNDVKGRVRIAIYLDCASSTQPRSNPAVVMISNEDCRSWQVLEVVCDACRYRRRRSSFTEGSDTGINPTTISPQDTNNSPCSYVHRNRDQIQSDFQDISSFVPSAQELLRITHIPMMINTGSFTQIRVDTPPEGVKWCPLAGGGKSGILGDSNVPRELGYRTRIPTWSDKFKALALEFKNRQVLPSRRNYHLISDMSQSPTSYFYRTAKSEYVMEILPDSQLSIMQAFCIALTTSLWS